MTIVLLSNVPDFNRLEKVFHYLCLLSGRPSPGCTRVESACPFPCSCYDGVLDCRDKALTVIPSHIPDAATDL